jgi:hypothetical protein
VIASAVLSVVYLAATLHVAAVQGLWNDEIYVFHVARVPTVGAVWAALAAGADNLPPLDYWLRHASMSAFGSGHLAFRLPSLVAVGTTTVAVFLLIQRRVNVRTGLCAALLMLIVTGYAQSFEERGYAILLATFALALQAWDRLAERWSPQDAVVLTVSLAAGVWAHYYGVFQLLAFLCAGCVETVTLRRIPARRLAALGGAAALCLPLVPLARVASSYRDGFWAAPTGAAALSFYPSLLSRATPCFVAMAVPLVLAVSGTSGRQATPLVNPLPFPLVSVLASAALLPVPVFLVAVIHTGAFHPKYLPATAMAISTMVALLASRLVAERRWATTILVVLPSCFFLFQAVRQHQGLATSRFRAQFTEQLRAFQSRHAEPTVIGDDAQFVELMHEDTAKQLDKTVFVYDLFPDERTNVDHAVAGLQRVMTLPAYRWSEFQTVHPTFFAVAAGSAPVVRRAVADGARVELLRDESTGLDYWKIAYAPAP